MAIGAADIALRNFGEHAPKAPPVAYRVAEVEGFFAPRAMIEFKNDRIGLPAIYAGVLHQVAPKSLPNASARHLLVAG